MRLISVTWRLVRLWLAVMLLRLERRLRPLIPHIRRAFGLSVHGTVTAIRDANRRAT